MLSIDIPYDEGFMAHLRTQLQTGLSGLGLTICTEPTTPEPAPVARITLRRAEGKPDSLYIEVRDTLTEKSLSRELDLSDLPLDSHPFAVALACDELLRASWLELAVRAPHAPPKAASKALIAELRKPPPTPPQPLRSAIGVAAALETYLRGELHYGADLVVSHWFPRALGVEALAGLREGSAVQGDHGSARASLLGGAVTLRYRPIETRRFSFSLGARTQAWRVTLRGRARGNANDDEGAAWAVVEQLSLLSTFYPHARCALSADLGAGIALREAVATDEGEQVAGVFGPHLVSSLRVTIPL